MKKKAFIIILIVCIVSLAGYIVYDRIISNTSVEKPTKEQLKLEEIGKLKQGLIKAGYIDIGNNQYKIADFESETIDQETNKPITYTYTTFSIDDLLIKQESKNPLSYYDESYSYRTDTASGSLSAYLEFTQFNYDFNHGTSNCDRNDCSTYINNLIGLKNRFIKIINDSNVNLDYLK